VRAGSRIRKLLRLLLTLVVFDLLSGIAPASAELLPVPQNLVALDSILGEQLLFNAEARRAYFPLSAQFVAQKNQGLCGIASLVMGLNALHVPAPESARLKPFSAFDQSNIAAGSSESIR
jgi:glutathione-S-conjugate glycine hydrolase